MQHAVPVLMGVAPDGVDASWTPLLSYGPVLEDAVRLIPPYIDRILRGAQPGSLPVQVGTPVRLIVNQQTAGRIGVTIPSDVLARATQVIE
jgi:putative ABC transport system substrate-binding protein